MADPIELAKSLNRLYIRGTEYNPVFAVADLLTTNNITSDIWEFRVNKFSGMLMCNDEDNKRSIIVNAKHPPQRRLFTIAHELGHYYLHRDCKIQFMCNDLFQSDYPTLEKEANDFAAELLMPEEIVLPLLDNRLNLGVLASKLGVSHEAMKWRYISICETHVPGFMHEHRQELVDQLFDDRGIDYNHKYLQKKIMR